MRLNKRMTTDKEKEELTETQIQKKEQADFSAGFDKVNNENQIPVEEKKEPEVKAEEKEEKKPEPTDQEKFEAGITKRMRAIEGKFGSINSTVTQAITDMTTVQSKQPDLTDEKEPDESMAGLIEDYPEAKSHFEKKVVTVEEFDQQLNQKLDERERKREAKEADVLATQQLNEAHAGWKEDVNSQDWFDWILEDGPSFAAYEEMNVHSKTAPDRATSMVNRWAREYPQWWADRGVLLLGDATTEDAIELLDGYKSRSGGEKEVSKGKTQKKKRQQRMQDAVTPDGGSGTPTVSLNDTQRFAKGFNRVMDNSRIGGSRKL